MRLLWFLFTALSAISGSLSTVHRNFVIANLTSRYFLAAFVTQSVT